MHMKKAFAPPTKEETNQLRGIAILGIIFYNFIRHLIGIDGNEMFWNDANIMVLYDGVKSFAAPLYIISYLGWYGVPVFLFISGFGLSVKYGTKDLSTLHFVKCHLLKLLRLMIPAYLMYLCIYIGFLHLQYPKTLIIKQCTLTANFLSTSMNPGVYWFFGLMAQFYILFLFVRKWNKTRLAIAIIISIAIDYLVLYCLDDKIMVFIRHNSVGWLSSFLFGMLFAKIESIKVNHQLGVILFVVFVISSLIKCLHPVSPLLFITTFLIIVKHQNNATIKYVGVLSSSLFAIHPLTRLVLYNTLTDLHLVIKIVIYTISTFCVAYLYSKIQNYLSSNWEGRK